MASISIETKKFADLPVADKVPDNGTVLIHDGSGVKTAKVKELIAGEGAGAHNSIYRGRNLGNAVTAEQYAAIEAGTFDDLYIGDYWRIDNINWRIAAFDYYLKTGEPKCETHHLTIVPDQTLYGASMNDTNVTKMRTENLEQAKTQIKTIFGAAHILNHKLYLDNATTEGLPSGRAWFDSEVELMTEQNVCGNSLYAGMRSGSIQNWAEIDKSQYPLFAFRPDLITLNYTYWLRGIVGTTTFAMISISGVPLPVVASNVLAVRPAFSIKA